MIGIVIIRICFAYSILFFAFQIIRILRRQNIESVKICARENGNAFAIRPRRQFEADCWIMADLNSWGVFAATPESTVVVFDYSGNAFAEIILPMRFKRFRVDDTTLTIVGSNGDVTTLPFAGIKWFASKTPFTFSHASDELQIDSIECTTEQLRVRVENEYKTFHYFSAIPHWLYTALFAVQYACCIIIIILSLILALTP